ncbi:hypothetical protein F4813DRAFT_205180 [Daldinia decipiens]|uniref:uncharacterized protein n=1 Tax=Daldinia decipiens TaxID=326647 RepID=UPI0020C1FFE0|nr:uncharacterized protein F4813DRAFT_205180 [Daldinia decipiens]KAI1654586.1 hypothetical protein F4813DRAFT_205180 [Daldinia decipiens]
MTAGNPRDAPSLSGAPSMRISPANIEQVDVLARKLYKRARANPELEEVANAVRSLHAVLKHLKFETEDPGSLLNVDGNAVYTRQLTPILEDSEFALKQLDTILDKKYGRGSNEGSTDSISRGMQMDGEKGWTVLESRERDMINLIHTKLTNQKLNIDLFLDTVQLHNPSKSRHLVDTNSANLDSIKDKVDFIASRICQRTNSNLSDGNEDELWEQFRDELEHAGFSKDVLRKNQDVIRAYIRQLDNQLSANGGSTPSVRGLLEYYRPRGDDGLQITPYPTNPTPADFSPGGLQPNIDEEKLFPSMRMKRLEDEDNNNKNTERQISKPPSMSDYPTNFSYDRHSSGGDESTALMSTRELMAFDKQSNMALAMENMHLQQPPNPAGSNNHMSISPTLHYLPPSASQPALPSSAPQTAPEPFGTHLHRPPPLPSASVSSPPTRRPNSVSVAEVSQQQQQALVTSTQRNARLAPDSRGREIPLDAKWTRISRRLVSPEVLAGAGVRYEARPDFVAVLGELSRDEVTYFAHRTTEVRAARGRRTSNTPAAATVINGGGVKGRKVDDKYHPDKYRNWDVIEAEKRQRQRQRRKEGNKNSHGTDSDDDTDEDGVTYIVNNRNRRRKGSTASTVSALYDSSNDSESSDGETDSDDRDQESHGSSSYSQSYPRSSSYLDDYHHSRSQAHRRSSTIPSTSRKCDDKAHSQAKGRVNGDATDGNERGAKTYPFIVSPPSSTIGKDKGKDKDTGTGTSPAATTKPKPILKNKNDDPHVRIDPNPQIIEEGSSSLPRSLPSYRRSERERRERDKDRNRERSKDRDRDRDRENDRDRDRDRDREKRYRSDRYTAGGREKERYGDRDRDRDRGDRTRDKEYYSNRDRDEGRAEYPHRHRHRSHGHRYHSSSAPRKERDREYYDDHYTSSSNRPREDRTSKKKARDETIRAVGLGGAAAAMLSMLSEAAL